MTAADARPSTGLLARITVVAAVLLVLVFVGRQLAAAVPTFSQYVAGLGSWGPVLFVLGYIVATVAFVPASILTLSAGAIFGIGKGVFLVFVAAMIGSTLAFLLSRYVARDAVARRVANDVRFAAVDRAVGARGLRIVLLLRLSPAFPFSLMNYALGLTRISLRDYMLAGIGMVPGTLLYVYYGKLVGDVASLAGGVAPPRDWGYYAVLGLGLVATIVVTTLVTRTAREGLRQATAESAAARVPQGASASPPAA